MQKQLINGYYIREPEMGITEYHKLPNGKIVILREHHNWCDFILSTWFDVSAFGTSFDETTIDYWGCTAPKALVFWNCDGTFYHPDDIAGEVNTNYHMLCKINNIRHHRAFNRKHILRGGGRFRRNARVQNEVRQSLTLKQDVYVDDHDCEFNDYPHSGVLRQIKLNDIQPRRKRQGISSISSIGWDDRYDLCDRPTQRNWKHQRSKQWR